MPPTIPKSHSSSFTKLLRLAWYYSIETPAAVRLALLLMEILNYMWIEAMFVNTETRDSGECMLGLVCASTSWLVHRMSAFVIVEIVDMPGMRIM